MDDYVNMTVGDFQRWYDHLNPRTENSKVSNLNFIFNFLSKNSYQSLNNRKSTCYR